MFVGTRNRHTLTDERYDSHMSAFTIQAATTPLTALDRCDRCGAQAYVRATLSSGFELLFCGHDWRIHGESVRAKSQHVHDETAQLTAPPVSSVPVE